MPERFYINQPITAGPLVLQGPEVHHLVNVKRLRPPEEICLFNGDGLEYPAVITSVDRRNVQLLVDAGRGHNRELPFRLVVACPLPKVDRGRFLIEKLTELGVTNYVPLVTERTTRGGSASKLERYIIEACKQCGRNRLIQIENETKWTAFACSTQLPSRRYFSDPEADAGIAKFSATDCVIAIGPEGGFTPAERELAVTNGWQPISLGPRILRVETAAIALASLLACSPTASG